MMPNASNLNFVLDDCGSRNRLFYHGFEHGRCEEINFRLFMLFRSDSDEVYNLKSARRERGTLLSRHGHAIFFGSREGTLSNVPYEYITHNLDAALTSLDFAVYPQKKMT